MHDPLPCKVSQLDTPLGCDAVSDQLYSPACPRFCCFCFFQFIQPEEVLLDERTVLPGDGKQDMKELGSAKTMKMRTRNMLMKGNEDEDVGKYLCARILFMSFKCFPPIRACMMSRYCCKITFLVWAAFSSNDLILGTFSSYLISPTKRQSSLCSWVKL